MLSLTTSLLVKSDNAQVLECERDSTKSGLWSLDWTVDWTLDNNGPNIWTRISIAMDQRSSQINQLQSFDVSSSSTHCKDNIRREVTNLPFLMQ